MPLMTVPVAITTANIVGAALPFGYVDFELTRADFDGTLVVPQKQRVQLDATGAGAGAFWPNSRGVQGAQYRVSVYAFDGTLQASGFATFPAAPCNLHDVLTLVAASLDPNTVTALAAQAAAVAARSYANLILVGL